MFQNVIQILETSTGSTHSKLSFGYTSALRMLTPDSIPASLLLSSYGDQVPPALFSFCLFRGAYLCGGSQKQELVLQDPLAHYGLWSSLVYQRRFFCSGGSECLAYGRAFSENDWKVMNIASHDGTNGLTGMRASIAYLEDYLVTST